MRRALVADRGAQAVRRTMGVQLAQDMDISGSSAAQSRQIAAAVGPLAQHLARILASQAAARPSRVSIRGTLRRAMGTGGVPFSVVTAPPRGATNTTSYFGCASAARVNTSAGPAMSITVEPS